MKKLTWILGLLLLGMSLITGRAVAVTEVPPVVEVTPAGQERPQVDARRSAVWYRQMRQAVSSERKSAAKSAEVAKPVFYIDGAEITEATKEVTSGTEVTISCATTGAKVVYTTNGSDPDEWSMEYEEAITITQAMTIKAYAFLYDDEEIDVIGDSEIVSVSFTIEGGTGGGEDPGENPGDDPVEPTVAKPVFYIGGVEITEATKEVATGTQVSISCATNGAAIAYTTDGSDPKYNGDDYSDAITITQPMTLKAVASVTDEEDLLSGTTYSEIAIVTFTIAGGENPGTDPVEPTVATPVFKIGDEVVTGTKEVEAGTQVSISCTTDGAKIWYTTDGSTPLMDLSGSKYTAPITVNTDMTIKAFAYTGDGENSDEKSDEVSVSFTIKGGGEPVTVATPVFKVGGKEVTGTVELVSGVETKVSISCATTGAKIYYTTNGFDPASNFWGEEYVNGALIPVSDPMTIRAIAKLGNAKSEEAKIEFKEKGDDPGNDPGNDPGQPGEAVNPPFRCKFDSAADFAAKWMVSDHDGDKWTWRYVTGNISLDPAFDGSYTNGYAKSNKNEESETADYMMTKAPIRMPAGEAHVAFKYALGSWSPVRLKVYYSKTFDAELSDMTLVGEVEKSEKYYNENGMGWMDTAMAFTLAEAGDYHFCFVHCSEPDEFGINTNGIYLDNVIIDTGRFVPTPELQVEHVILPLSSCALGTEETIYVRVRSIGTERVTNMSLSYQVDGGEAVTEQFAVSLAPNVDTTIAFAHKADFSEEGKTYTVSVSCAVEGEKDLTDNEGTACVTNFTPVETLPFVVNTNEAEGRSQLGYDSEAWTYYEEEGFGNWSVDPLVTRCMPLKGGETYRFSFDRKTGVDLGMMQLPESFWVVYAPAGTDNTKILKYYEGDYTNEVYVREEFLVTPASDGNYYFGIVPDEKCNNASLFISRIRVEKVGDHDVAIVDMTTTLAKRTPAIHAATPVFNVWVVNRGMNTEKVKVTVKNGDKEVGKMSEITVKKADTAYYRIKGDMAGLETGEVNLRFEATMAETDAYPEDNTLDWTFTATDSLYAFDKDTTYEKRAMTSQYVIGEIFMLAEPDTLSSLMLGWSPLEKSIDFGVEIYPVNEIGYTDYYRVGECLFSEEFERQAEGGMKTVPMGVVLPAGRYFIGLKRVDASLLHIGFDEQPEGRFYMLSQGIVGPNTAYGYLAIRAVFGKAGKLIMGNEAALMGARLISYPNPVSGLWTVSADGMEINRVEISDVTGCFVYRSADNLSVETWSVNMEGFKPGLYVARVYTNSGVQTIKVMVR